MGCCGHVARGAVGMTRAITGTDPVTRETRLMRQAECDACEHRRGPMCGRCGCVVAAKIRVASEACPVGRWLSERSSGTEGSAD